MLELNSPCKVNLFLNILGKRPDGFHDLETVMHPVSLFDTLTLAECESSVRLTCNNPSLPTDSRNLACRAAEIFLERTGIRRGVTLHLEKRIPTAAGLGGGSGNAATALLGMNRLFGSPLNPSQLHEIAALLGSDVPFFLQSQPAYASGRGDVIQPLDAFPALRGAAFLLIHPGFGISTAWAYQNLARFPDALNGVAGRARKVVALLQGNDLEAAGAEFYNSLEAPAFHKYPLLQLFREFLRRNGAAAALMSGSGSTTFALAPSIEEARRLLAAFTSQFGSAYWTAVIPVAAQDDHSL